MDSAAVERRTRRWLEHAVVGLELCPFAKPVVASGRVRLVVSAARDTEALVFALADEARHLAAASPADDETTLLVHPQVLRDFADYNDFLDIADALLAELGLEGVLQIASFHPGYCFADSAPDDPANATNRSPYPMLQLLREESLTRALEHVAEPERIYERNIDALRRLGWDGWRALWDDPGA